MFETLPVLTVLQHDPDVPLDRFAAWLEGVETRVVRLDDGEPVPAVDALGAGLLVLGGDQNAYDDERAPWLPATRRLLADAVAADVPVLGICLGHQLLAAALGGRVEVAPPPGREAGIVPVMWRPEAREDPVLGAAIAAAAPDVVAAGELGGALVPSMHADAVVDLPAGGRWLAFSTMYPFQAMRVGSALGVQFHPEASPELLARWAASSGEDAAAVLAQARARDAHVAPVGRAIAQAFAAQVRAAARQRLAA
ncbi:type 1 glutamine amidotransferase [Georgenia ruanii]|uniref:Type 1 glutamine amidotransferase n=1 Tax=Georgenia ruanii TaxID=348442 RepID=A0A7J9V3G5_9MICO|nr:type 1 glutamine amidotransferase [Georgenia ruanii]MPV90494.1 type 1 glutamine amidotransferase [Georgenia ruanii]